MEGEQIRSQWYGHILLIDSQVANAHPSESIGVTTALADIRVYRSGIVSSTYLAKNEVSLYGEREMFFILAF